MFAILPATRPPRPSQLPPPYSSSPSFSSSERAARRELECPQVPCSIPRASVLDPEDFFSGARTPDSQSSRGAPRASRAPARLPAGLSSEPGGPQDGPRGPGWAPASSRREITPRRSKMAGSRRFQDGPGSLEEPSQEGHGRQASSYSFRGKRTCLAHSAFRPSRRPRRPKRPPRSPQDGQSGPQEGPKITQ